MRKKIFIAILTILILPSLIFGCSGETKYTAAEWEKIKALRNKGKEQQVVLEEDKVESYYKKLEEYNNYVKECINMHYKYYETISRLTDYFNNENNDLDKKNNYAELIIDEEKKWISDLNKIEVPYFLNNYNNYLLEFLNKDKLFYVYFSKSYVDEADRFANEADLANDNGIEELDRVQQNFNKEAKELGLPEPFNDVPEREGRDNNG